MSTVGSEFPKEVARVHELRDAYKTIGPAGAFALSTIDQALARATEAQSSGDVVEIIRSFQELRSLE